MFSWRWIAFAAVAPLAIAAVLMKARHDSADPSRCGTLVAMGTRCCAPGQRVEAGRCIGTPASCPSGMHVADGPNAGCVAEPRRVAIAGGTLHAGAGDWEASGRIEAHDAVIAPFDIDDIEITEAAYEACANAGACPKVALSGEPGRALAGITFAEARAYCAYREGRLPTDDEWTWVCGGTKARRYAWGDTGAVCRRAAFGLERGPCGYGGSGPELAGTHPDGDSPEKIHDLAGNVAEWVEAGKDHTEGRVRGGSWQSSLATELRSWQTQPADPNVRSAAVGARCAYDRK